MIFPAIVEKRDAAIDRLLDDLNRRRFVRGIAQVMATKSQCRHLLIVPPKWPHGNRVTL
jgi:hypothetical protein